MVEWWKRHGIVLGPSCFLLGFVSLMLAFIYRTGSTKDSSSSKSLVIHKEKVLYPLKQHLTYFTNEGQNFSINDILSRDMGGDSLFKEKRVKINGDDRLVHWTKVSISNQVGRELSWTLAPESLEITSIDVFVVDRDKKVQWRSSTGIEDIKQGKLSHHLRFLIPVHFKSEFVGSLYIRTKFSRQVLHSSYLATPEKMSSYLHSNQLLINMCIGLIVGIALYNLFLFVVLREVSYGLYLAFTFGFLFCTLLNRGYIDYYFLNGIGLISTNKHFLTIPTLSALPFAYTFLKANVIMPRFSKFMIFCMFLILSLGLWGILNPPLAGKFSSVQLAVSSLVALISGLIAIFRRYLPARYFLLAWGVMLVSIILWRLVQNELLPSSIYSNVFSLFGVSWEILFMSLALGDRINISKDHEARADLKQRESSLLREMVRILCHDITNPLTVISYHANNFKGKESQKKIMKAAKVIMAIVDHSRKLEASRSGKLALLSSKVSIKEVIVAAAETLEVQLGEKNISMEYKDFQDWDRYYVLGDQVHLSHEVFANILSNAIKYSFAGESIRIEVLLRDKRLKVRIIDRGIGIPEDLQKQIFDSAVSTSRKGTNGEQGTGFGMPIVKSLVESMGGEIHMKSVVKEDGVQDHGTTIEISLLGGVF